MLTTEQVTKFQMLYKSRFGREINRSEAYEQGVKLMRLVELLYKPMTKSEYAMVQERRLQAVA